MPRPRQSALIASAAAVVVASFNIGCERLSQGKARPSASAGPPVTRVEVVRPEHRTVRRIVSEPGQIQAFETAAIYAKIAGHVQSWTANIGARVKKGQVMAELFVPEMEADLRQKRAAVEQAIAKRKQAEAAIKVAQADVAATEAKLVEVRAGAARAAADVARWKSEFRRVEQLFRERAQTGTLLDETRNKLRSAEASEAEVEAQIKSAEAALTQSHAALDQARSDLVAAASAIDVDREDAHRAEALLGYAKIAAPFDGIVTRRNAETGELTKPGSDAEPLFIVARSDIVTITTDIPETYATEVNPDSRATIEIQGVKRKPLDAKVTRTAWALDPKARTLRVEFDVPNPDASLRPGLYVYVTVVADEHKNVLTVPTTAVVKEKDKTYCVVVREGKALRRAVVLGLNDATSTEIASGLAVDDRVVKAYASTLADGQPVEVLQPAEPTPPAAKP